MTQKPSKFQVSGKTTYLTFLRLDDDDPTHISFLSDPF